MKNKKMLWILLVLAVILVLYFSIKWWNRDVVAVKTAVASRGTIEAVVSASGVVDAPVYALGTKMGGKISEWKVKEGTNVKKGQLVAVFDNFEQARNDFERTEQLYDEGAASKQAYDAAKTIYESSRIVAPADGIVAKINFLEGETVVPGAPAVTIVNYEKSWVETQIDEIDIANLKIGDKVAITTDVYPDKVFEGEIYWIAPLAELRKVGGRVKMDEESYVFLSKIKFLGNHDELKVNMSVNVDVVTKKVDNALIISRETLVSRGEEITVFAVRKGRVFQVPIKTGIRSYTSVEVLSGLTEGDVIALSNGTKLKDNGRIKIER
ncbi:MAG: RND family efflux transporter MFP subunit [Candidatus Saganbacteria bacterium]|uniref:RND family efflux transporter MFP subunit n=1 Tax=Candidatus Saganbacteria bacterium TaxID=2575572 RepID=A0A833L0F2_UNCSA|nr:MAG: RND family efflux transporter MFP subunit [Candidatus Saganbacteria bacterium]